MPLIYNSIPDQSVADSNNTVPAFLVVQLMVFATCVENNFAKLQELKFIFSSAER